MTRRTTRALGGSAAVSAPGKAFLIGEYAVLEGAPALVAAVDVRAVAFPASDDRPSELSAVVRCAHARVGGYLEGRGAEPVGAPPVVDTGGFSMGPRKLGLGSSAAVAASVVGYHLAAAGLDPRDADVQQDALSLALAAHAEAQGGGGSGADVAAAVLGGTIRFEQRRATRIDTPPWLHVAFVDAGTPADTSSFVRTVRAAGERNPTAYASAISQLRGASEAFFAAWEAADARRFGAFVDAVGRHVAGLRMLQELSGAPILTAPIETTLRLAAEAGLAAKPSGAGGGDLVVVLASDRGDLDRFLERLRREHGLPALGDLRLDAEGLRTAERVPVSSRMSGFFKLSVVDRRAAIARTTGLPVERLAELDEGGLDVARANCMIENVVGTLELPLAIATNFRINGKDVLVPMAVEEASVVAAASNAAKMIREGGGFSAHSDPPWMIAQVQLVRGEAKMSAEDAVATALESRAELLAISDEAHPRLVGRGGGAREIEARALADDMIVVHVLVDCKDAMGANLINTVAEAVAPRLEERTGWTAGLRILSNLADRRCAHVSCRVPPEVLEGKGFTGAEVIERIVAASRFAELDPYRAATHNKGIMNGVDAVVLATGNDWRAMEASAHAYASISSAPASTPAGGGRYGPLAIWRRGDDGWLEGKMSLPAAVGVVGGATRVHPVCRLALEILGCASGIELGQVMAAAGLASNLAALRAMATEGIQRGHMSLHARTVALEAGARGSEVEALAHRLIEHGEIKAERAKALLAEIRTTTNSPNPEKRS